MHMSQGMMKLTAAFLTVAGLATAGCGAGQMMPMKDIGTAQSGSQEWSVAGAPHGVDHAFKTTCVNSSSARDGKTLGAPEKIGQLGGQDLYYLSGPQGQRVYFTGCSPGH